MRLTCISRYRTAKLDIAAGTVLDLSAAEARHLMADAPGCWEDADALAQAEAERALAELADEKALDAPPADTMVKKAPVKK